MNLTGQSIHQKSETHRTKRNNGKDPERLAKVAELPCVICFIHVMQQKSPTQVHHCIHGRHSSRKAPDSMTIPLCEGHHQGLRDNSKIALHSDVSYWKRLYGLDVEHLPLVDMWIRA